MSKNIIRSKAECQKILDDMRTAADRAANLFIAQHEDKGACGYAQVVIPKEELSLRRAEGSPFPRRLSYRGQMPAAFVRCGPYQTLNGLEAVAAAAAESLRANGVDAYYNGWMD